MGYSLVLTYIMVFCTMAWAGKHDMYSRYSVHRVSLRTPDDRQLLMQLETSLRLDMWERGYVGEKDWYVMVSPENVERFLEELDMNNIKHSLHRSDVSKALEEFDLQLAAWQNTRTGRRESFDNYPTYAEVDKYLEEIAANYSNLVTLVNAGLSYEGRSVKYLKISTSNFTDASKPIYFMDAAMHAREWVTTPVTLYSIHRLVVNLREQDKDLLEDIDWIILPIVNPDGYEYSHTTDRMWRKSRSYNANVSEHCYGVDVNRNFDVDFNTIGVSSDPCEDNYPGTTPFSEREAGYLRDIMLEYLDRIQIYMNIHSQGNWILYGYDNRTLPSNSLEIYHVGATMGAAIDAHKLLEDTKYRVGNSAMLLYPVSGSSQDYGQVIGIPCSYTLELPGYGYGFIVPPEYINQINTETWAGIAASARLSRTYYRARG